MAAEKANFAISWLCRHLEVARSGFYQWLKRSLSARSQQWAGQIQTLFEQSQNSYGSPRIHDRLQQQGWSISRKRVIRLMQQFGWVARPHPRHPSRKATGSEAVVAQNLLQRQFQQAHPTSRICPPPKVGATWRCGLTCSLAAWWAGRLPTICAPNWWWRHYIGR